MRIFRKYQRAIATFSIFTLCMTYAPTTFALTGHQNMPEYRSFEPVATTNMVDLFSGDFTYNIPLMNIPNGAPINIAYHSGNVSNEAQATNVGLGWTLNPGAINRTKRGYADEFTNAEVIFHNRMENNWTVEFDLSGGIEAFSQEVPLSLGYRPVYNNYSGWRTTTSIGVGYGAFGLNLNFQGGRVGYSPVINPKKVLKRVSMGALSNLNISVGQLNLKAKNHNTGRLKLTYGSVGFSNIRSMPVSAPPIQTSGLIFSTEFAMGLNFFGDIEVKPEARVRAGVNVNWSNNDGVTKSVNGYLHTHDVLKDDKDQLLDYSVQGANRYDKKDNALGYPTSNSDVFVMASEGLGGSFKPLRTKSTIYRPNYTKSETFSVEGGVEVGIMSGISPAPPGFHTTSTFGYKVGGAYNLSEIKDWNEYVTDDASEDKDSYIYRFGGDLFENADYTADDTPYEWIHQGTSEDIDEKKRELQKKYTKARGKNGLVVHLNEELGEENDYSQFSKVSLIDGDNLTRYDYSKYGVPKGIGEIVSYNEAGNRYCFGLPLYSKNEKQLSYSIKGENGITVGSVASSGVMATGDTRMNLSSKRKIGQEIATPYATQYLLTSITSPDYLDRTLDGPTPDDFGSYTRYYYEGNNSEQNDDDWFAYRTPFKGFTFNAGSLSNDKDDMLSMSFGEKETYYIKQMVSKTHIAIFDYTDREDAYGMATPYLIGGDNPDMDIMKVLFPNIDEATYQIQTQKKLSSIKLYALKDCTQEIGEKIIPKDNVVPLQTVHLEYDYELCPDVLNNIDVDILNRDINPDIDLEDTDKGTGKLTLKKVWFEYQGKVKYSIAPYEFEYAYTDVAYPAVYDGIEGYGNGLEENPVYKVENTDAWGNYRSFENLKQNFVSNALERFFPFVNQNEASLTTFDPASYCLKQIKLPSGGEIHVQYEQDEYCYVQDQRAMVMVPLSDLTGSWERNAATDNKKYYLDLSKIGIEASTLTNEQLKTMFAAMEGEQKRRMYFKFLYRLLNNKQPSYTEYTSDYIDGYARIASYGVENTANGDQVYFTFNKLNNNEQSKSNLVSYNEIDYGTELSQKRNRREVPRKVCKDFYKNNRKGIISEESNVIDNQGETDDESGLRKLLRTFSAIIGVDACCKRFDPEMSYVRISLPSGVSKKGGGVRVKRLMMYDEGIGSNAEPVLYGSEYDYSTQVRDGSFGRYVYESSGVATFEPGSIRKENPLVNPIDKTKQNKVDALVFGRGMADSEGPLGEALYPGASVSYANVRVKSIHRSAKSGIGIQEHQFYTCKDFPFIADLSSIQAKGIPIGIGSGGVVGSTTGTDAIQDNNNTGKIDDGDTYEGSSTSFGGGYSQNIKKLHQGFSFVMNDMHGKPKKVATLSDLSVSVDGKEQVTERASTVYEYSKIGAPVNVKSSPYAQAVPTVLGKTAETLSESSTSFNLNVSGNFDQDFNFGFYQAPITAPPIPGVYTTAAISANVKVDKLHQLVTTKIINYSTVLKKVTQKQDGVKTTTEYKSFDKYTGAPVEVLTYDDFDTPYLATTTKGSWVYRNLKSKSLNLGLEKEVEVVNDNGAFYIDLSLSGACDKLEEFAEGDLYQFSDNKEILYHVNEVNLSLKRVYLTRSGYATTGLSAGTKKLKVLRSGYTNQTTADVGSVVYFDSSPLVRSSEQRTEEVEEFLGLVNSELSSNSDNVFQFYGSNTQTSGFKGKTASESNKNIPFPTGLQIWHPNKGWIDEKDFEDVLRFTRSTADNTLEVQVRTKEEGTRRIYYGGYEENENSQCNSHPLVNKLNQYLDDWWNYNAFQSDQPGIAIKGGDMNTIPIRGVNQWPYRRKNSALDNSTVQPPFFQTRIDNSTDYDFIKNRFNSKYTNIVSSALKYINGQETLPTSSLSLSVGNIHDKRIFGIRKNTVSQSVLPVSTRLKILDHEILSYHINEGDNSGVWPDYGWNNNVGRGNVVWSHSVNGYYTRLTCNPTVALGVSSNNPFFERMPMLKATFADTYGNREICTDRKNVCSPFGTCWDCNNGYEDYQYTPVAYVEDIDKNFFNTNGKRNRKDVFEYTCEGGRLYLIWHAKKINGQSVGDQKLETGIEFYANLNPNPIICQSTISNFGDDFVLDFDYETQTLVGREIGEDGCIYPIGCVKVKGEETKSYETSKVVSASAITLSDDWSYDIESFSEWKQRMAEKSLNDYETGAKGKWRVKNNYVFRSEIDNEAIVARKDVDDEIYSPDNKDNVNYRNYDRGTFTLNLFDWSSAEKGEEQEAGWVKTSTVNRYSPQGFAVEDENLRGIKSTAVYGYNYTLPTAVAQNASYGTVTFESFEDDYSNAFTGTAHTGNYALELDHGNSSWSVVRDVTDEEDKSFIVRAWLKSSIKPSALEGYLKVNLGTQESPEMKYISSSGEWQLYEAVVYESALGGLNQVSTSIYFDKDSYKSDYGVSSEKARVFIDDIRIQPVESEMVTYVYDDYQRLIAVFDDQHYAMLYQYNEEGALIRKQKETINGVKTLSETQYHTREILKRY